MQCRKCYCQKKGNNKRFKKVESEDEDDGSHIYIDEFGYHHAVLCNNQNVLVDNYLHELVAVAFVSNPNGFKKVKHINGDKSCNRADNLEWVEDFSYLQR